MTRPTQGLLMAFLGAVLVRLAATDAHLRYVTDWMRWPVLVSGVVLIALAVGLVVSDRADDHGHDHGHRIPLVTWLLVLPGLVTFVVSPPELGSYLAERRAGETQTIAQPDDLTDLSDLGSAGAVPIDVSEFIWRAQDGGTTLEDQAVSLTGFVSYDQQQNWYVTRMTIGCCAADALAFQVQVSEADRPPRDTWVEVVGTYAAGSGTDGRTPPVITAVEVKETDAPAQTYE